MEALAGTGRRHPHRCPTPTCARGPCVHCVCIVVGCACACFQKHFAHNGVVDGKPVFYGAKWQCVEFARRWLIHVKGYTFPSIGMAYTIFDLNHVIRISDGAHVPLVAVPNGTCCLCVG